MTTTGADADWRGKGGKTALMLAAAQGRLDHVRLLLDHGADPALTDRAGETALTLARERGHGEVVGMLTQAIDRRRD